jgi:hypothetical protein
MLWKDVLHNRENGIVHEYLKGYKNGLLSFMLFCFLITAYYIYINYNSNISVSNLICDPDYKYTVFCFMCLLGAGTLWYEFERNDPFSIVCICILLVGLYGLIYVNETNRLHYIFASVVFLSILVFMMRHCYLTSGNKILLSSLVLEIILLFFIIQHIHQNIFYSEVLYILNFACYYLYLHFT